MKGCDKLKTIEDFKEYYSEHYDGRAQEAITEFLATQVANRYRLHEDPESFIGSDDYYDVEAEFELVNLIIEDDSRDSLLFHICYRVNYGELYCNPHSLVDIYRCYQERDIESYITVDFTGSAENGFQNLNIIADSIQGLSKERAKKYRTEYSDKMLFNYFLLPDLRSEKNMKLAAQVMLDRYYPEFTDTTIKIDPNLLASSMGLNVVPVDYLIDDIEGIIFFEDGTYTSSASDSDPWKALLSDTGLIPEKLASYKAPAGTIVLVDSAGNRQNNTLAHECCHWFLHRKPYLLQILLGEEPPKVSCRQLTMAGSTTGSYFDMREWQASHLSPRVLIGNHSVSEAIRKRVKENRIINREKGLEPKILADEIREAIEEFSSECFLTRGGILVQLMKKYTGLEGILPCPEDHYIRPYMYDSARLERNETFDISEENYLFLYDSSEDFRFLIDSGLFMFVENHVCRVTADSVIPQDQGIELENSGYLGLGIQLSDETRMHMEKYCIKFRKAKNAKDQYKNTICGAYRYITKEVNEKLKMFDAGYAMPGDDIWEAATKGMQDINNIKSEMTGSLKHDLPILFEWSEKTKYRVSEDADLEKHTFPDLLKGKTKTMKPKTAIQLCIGMQLPYELSKCLLNAAQIEFDGSALCLAYEWIIRHLTFEPIEEANNFLAKRNLPLLGRA